MIQREAGVYRGIEMYKDIKRKATLIEKIDEVSLRDLIGVDEAEQPEEKETLPEITIVYDYVVENYQRGPFLLRSPRNVFSKK